MTGRTLIIAEAGVNHNGRLDLALELVRSAAKAGADVVKFQTFKAERLVTANAQKAGYQTVALREGGAQFEMLKALEMSTEMHDALMAECRERKIGFTTTAFDEDTVEYVAGLGVEWFKVPSGEITNLSYLRRIGGYARKVLLSTGMSTMDEIADALSAMEASGTPRGNITVLHCNTEYPTPMEDVNLHAMNTIGETFGVAVGYSDHTLGIEVPLAAVALGAQVIAKHLTLDRSMDGPDHRASLEPVELTEMVAAIRRIEQALGSPLKRPSPSESKNITAVRKSLVARHPINAGEIFSPENVIAKRPATGLSPMLWDTVMGTAAPRAFKKDEMIELA